MTRSATAGAARVAASAAFAAIAGLTVFAAPASAAPAGPVAVSDDCGFSFWKQRYTVCGQETRFVNIVFSDSVDRTITTTTTRCLTPGVHPLFNELGPGRLAVYTDSPRACGPQDG